MEVQAGEIHRELCRRMRNEVTDEDLIKMKGELKMKTFGGFGAGEIQREIITMDNVMEKLTRKGLIKTGKYGILRSLLKAVELFNLCEIIDEAENKLRAMHWPVESSASVGQPAQYGGGGYATQPPYHPHQPRMGYQDEYSRPPHPHDPYEGQPTSHYAPQSMYAQPSQDDGLRYTTHGQFPRPPPHQRDPHYAPPAAPQSYHDAQSGIGLKRKDSDEVFVAPKPPPAGNVPQNPLFDHRIFYEPGRGYVLFINNIFSGKPERRTGAERDETNIRELFHRMPSFYLHYVKDVSKQQLEGYLEAMKGNLGTGSYQSFILILGTHGEPRSHQREHGPEKPRHLKDAVLMADDQWMLVDDIVGHFHGDKIPAMKDKPKLFIIQSCRGKELQRSVSLSDSPAEMTAMNVQPVELRMDMLTRPVNSDVLIAYATTEGTKAWRNQEEGSWFVKDLCDVIHEFYNKEHILDILVRVNNKMVWRESTEGRAKQMPCFVCTFTKRFMFEFPNK